MLTHKAQVSELSLASNNVISIGITCIQMQYGGQSSNTETVLAQHVQCTYAMVPSFRPPIFR